METAGSRATALSGAPRGAARAKRRILAAMDDERAPICPACGVTMVPAELSGRGACGREWVCLECEESEEHEQT